MDLEGLFILFPWSVKSSNMEMFIRRAVSLREASLFSLEQQFFIAVMLTLFILVLSVDSLETEFCLVHK